MRPDHPWRKKGEKHPASKLTDLQRLQIRVMHEREKMSVKKLASFYGVCSETIYRVCRQ